MLQHSYWALVVHGKLFLARHYGLNAQCLPSDAGHVTFWNSLVYHVISQCV